MLTARVWREKTVRYLSETSRCGGCGRTHYPPRAICDRCGGREMVAGRLPESGKVLTWSVIRVAPPAFAQEVPYAVAVIEMQDGTRLTCQLADVAPEDISAGMPVRLEFRKIRQYGRTGIIAYAHKAVPA
jgi:hypothetical protein